MISGRSPVISEVSMCSPQRPAAFFTSLPDSLAGRHVGKQRGEAPAMVVVLCCTGVRLCRQRNRENRSYCDATEKRLLPRLPRLNVLSNFSEMGARAIRHSSFYAHNAAL